MQNEITATKPGKILATGSWYSKRDCSDSPKAGHHFMQDMKSRPSPNKGEVLITSQCKYCGGLIVDCPTIGCQEFVLVKIGAGKSSALRHI